MVLFLLLLVQPRSYATVWCEGIFSNIKNPWVWRPAKDMLLGLRSNVPHFWDWSAQNKALLSPVLLSFEGLVLGDPHLFNFGEVRLENGYKWSLNDIDDSGVGPFILDLVRFASTVEASNYRIIEFKDIYLAYSDGISGKDYSRPKIVNSLRQLSKKDVDRKWDSFFEKLINLNTEKINYGIKDIISFDSGPDLLKKFISKHLDKFKNFFPKGSSITDLGFRAKDFGGSQGLVRLYIATKSDQGLSVYEFKPLVRPGLDYYQQQGSQELRVSSIINLLWKNSIYTDYRYIKIEDQEYFMRIRLPKLFKLHDEEEFVEMNTGEKKEYLSYIANWIGKKHRVQMSNAEKYSDELEKESTFGQLEFFLAQYLQDVKKINPELD